TTSRLAPSLFLPSGRYRVEGRYGVSNVQTAREIELKAGQALQISLDLQIAALRLRFSGPVPTEGSWEVRHQEGRTGGTSDESETAATRQAGRYLVAMTGPRREEERRQELRAGEARLVEAAGD